MTRGARLVDRATTPVLSFAAHRRERSGDALRHSQIETSYPLGKLDAGSTYLQKYAGNSVTATAIAGPYVGSPASHFQYIAMPITHDILLLVWLEPKFKHNTFVYNFKTHLSSVVTWDQKGDPSLGSVIIVKRGGHPIP